MSVKRIKNHGTWVWQARVAYKRLRRAAFRATKEEARSAEAELLRTLKAEHGQAEQRAAVPATLRQLLTLYVGDMRARGKGDESVERVEYTARNIEAVTPELLERPVSRIGDAEIFAFRNARARSGVVAYDLVDGVKVPRRIPAKPSTIKPGPPHAPGGAQARPA